ncbi:MAG: efflux RND transporter periplasmic adaptor subunit [Candidatus Baltobacteraceae bacterium]
MKRLLLLGGILIAIAAVIFAAKIAGRPQHAITVKTQVVRRGVFLSKLPENGVVQHPRLATIPTLIAGNIADIDVKAGDTVGAGQLVATIQNPALASTAAGSQADYNSAQANIETARINEQNARVTYEGQVRTAKANLDEARRVYQADVALYNSRAIAKNQLETDKANLDRMQVAYDQAARQLQLGAVTGYGENSVQYARANAQKAAITNAANQEQLGFTRIEAPFAGVIQSVAPEAGDPLTTLHAGDPVTAGQMLFTLAESGNFIVKAQVDEQDIINVHPGQEAIVSGQDFPGKHLAGHVESIAPVAVKSSDASSTAKQVLTVVRLDRSPSYLKDGMTVDVDIVTSDVRNALLVPTDAIVNEGGSSFVFVVRSGKAHKVRISTDQSDDTHVVVTKGLSSGSRVVSPKVADLRDGSAVTVQ